MNINEIARLAGVSRATVSRYLNNGYVSEEKKAVIHRVIEETGYQPSSQAQMLMTKEDQTGRSDPAEDQFQYHQQGSRRNQ